MEKSEVFDRVGSCKENVRRNAVVSDLVEIVRSLFESCKEFVGEM